MADQSCTACANAGPATACAPQNLKGAIHQNDRSEDKINLYVTGDINAGLPCVILLYDIFGYGHDNLKKVADMISQNGFLVIIPDHFRADPWPIATEIDRSKLMEWYVSAAKAIFDLFPGFQPKTQRLSKIWLM
jgi:dienelactone hydrolase